MFFEGGVVMTAVTPSAAESASQRRYGRAAAAYPAALKGIAPALDLVTRSSMQNLLRLTFPSSGRHGKQAKRTPASADPMTFVATPS